MNADPDQDPATQINADPSCSETLLLGSILCGCDVLNFFLADENSWNSAYFVDDVGGSGDGESDVSDEEESESNDDSSQSGEEEGESSDDDEVELDIYLQCFRSGPDWIRIQSGQWIRSRIRIRNPDPGGQNDPQK